MSGPGVSAARAQSMDSAVLLDELEAAVTQVTAAVLATEAARARWAARLQAFRSLRTEVALLQTRVNAGIEAARLAREVAASEAE